MSVSNRSGIPISQVSNVSGIARAVLRAINGVSVPGAGPPVTNGNVTITAKRTTAHRDAGTNKAPFSVVAATLPTGKTFGTIYYWWVWTDVGGLHRQQGITTLLDIEGDGSASYAVSVKLYIVDGATGSTIDQNGAVVTGYSGAVTLTVTGNTGATTFTVSKVSAAITAVAGGTTYYANESTGNDTTGDGSVGTPYRTLARMLNARKASNQVWSVGAGTYEFAATVSPTSVSNWELLASASVTITWNHNGSLFDGGSNASDVRFALNGATVTRTYVSSTMAYVDDVDTVSNNVLIRGMAVTDCETIVNSGTFSGLYLIDNETTTSSYFMIIGRRNEHVWEVGNTMRVQDETIDEALNRIYNLRYSGFLNNDMETSVSGKPLIRLPVENYSDANYEWQDGSYSVSSYCNIRGNTLSQLAADVVACVALQEETSTSGLTRWEYVDCEQNTMLAPNATGGELFQINGAGVNELDSCRRINFRNNRLGRDPGAVVEAIPNGFQAANSSNDRSEIVIAGNDFILIKYEASWAGSVYIGGASVPVSGSATSNVMAHNLLLFNIYEPGGDGLLSFDGARASIASSWEVQGNTYVKTDTHGSGSSSQTGFEADGSGSQTRTNWLASGADTGSQGLDIADATLRSSNYNFTTYLTRDNAQWESDISRRAELYYDYAGSIRASSTTPGRYDPNATANTIGA
jgi:hypothetical protein